MNRWTLYIDIEGFSRIYLESEFRGLSSLGALMEAIYRVGTFACPSDFNRVFVHQTGDGFAIVSGSHSRDPSTPYAIAVVLMRCLLVAGGVAKCGLSEGHFADVIGCYPDIIRNNIKSSGVVSLGSGMMRIFPVMGSALVRAHQLTRKESGALLLVDAEMAKNLPNSIRITKSEQQYAIADWIHSDSREIKEITEKIGVELPSVQILEGLLQDYVSKNCKSVPPEWRTNTLTFNNCKNEM
jgi:hypothetical protein